MTPEVESTASYSYLHESHEIAFLNAHRCDMQLLVLDGILIPNARTLQAGELWGICRDQDEHGEHRQSGRGRIRYL